MVVVEVATVVVGPSVVGAIVVELVVVVVVVGVVVDVVVDVVVVVVDVDVEVDAVEIVVGGGSVAGVTVADPATPESDSWPQATTVMAIAAINPITHNRVARLMFIPAPNIVSALRPTARPR